MTMTLIQHIELASANATIELTSIPNTFTDLLLCLSVRTTRSAAPSYIRPYINGNTTNQTIRRLWGDGSSPSSSSESNNWGMIVSSAANTSNTFANSQIYIPNYAGSATKSFSIDSVSENNGTQAYQIIAAGLWNTTSAVSSIQIIDPDAQFVIGSSATLYGITKGSDGTTTVS